MKSGCELKLVGEVVATPYGLEAKSVGLCIVHRVRLELPRYMARQGKDWSEEHKRLQTGRELAEKGSPA